MIFEFMSKLKILQDDWDKKAQQARYLQPIKMLESLPKMAGIAEKNLKWKSFKWMITQDHDRSILKGFLRHPFKYTYRYLKSLFNPSFTRDGDFFFYGIQDEKEFQTLLQNPESIFVLGFSYCHKPFECPSGRFTPHCIHDLNNLVCQQCFISKAIHYAPERTIVLSIPTVHYIGAKIFEIAHQYPNKPLVFLITACEMTLNMFGDWGNMVGIKGIGVRLDGRICNTMKAFELSERGVKPGLTVLLPETKARILKLFNS